MTGRALRAEDIKVVSYVHVGDELVNTEDLSEEQKVTLATELASGWLNGLFAGKAVFRRKDGGTPHPSEPSADNSPATAHGERAAAGAYALGAALEG